MQQTKHQISNSGLNAQQTGIEGAQGKAVLIDGFIYEVADDKAKEAGLTLSVAVESLLCKWIFNLLRETDD